MAPKKKNKGPSSASKAIDAALKAFEARKHRQAAKLVRPFAEASNANGEALAVYGLCLGHLSTPRGSPNCRIDQALDLCKRGCRADLKSVRVWHLQGVLQQHLKDFDGALKSYSMAKMNASKSNQIFKNVDRETANLLLHTRQWSKYLKVRREMLMDRSSHVENWFGYAIANHALKNYDEALRALNEFRNASLNPGHAHGDSLESEVYLYTASVMIDAKEFHKALNFLQDHSQRVLDVDSAKELEVLCCMRLSKIDKGLELLRPLLEKNRDSYAYHYAMHCLLLNTELDTFDLRFHRGCELMDFSTLSEDQRAVLLKEHSKRSSSMTDRRLVLDLNSSPDEYDALLREYASLNLKVPSLVDDLLPLYSKLNTAEILESVLPRQSFHMAKHFDRLSDHTRALEILKNIKPQTVDSLRLQAKVLKHAGALESAKIVMESARLMDKADRFVNCASAKYHLRCGDFHKATEIVSEFSRPEGDDFYAKSIHPHNLYEMQASWYELELGAARLTKFRLTKAPGELKKAIKAFTSVLDHFKAYREDAFDFHGYCLRRGTLRTYVETLNSEERATLDPFYIKALRGLVDCYLQTHRLNVDLTISEVESMNKTMLVEDDADDETPAVVDAVSTMDSTHARPGKGGRGKQIWAIDSDPLGTARIKEDVSTGVLKVALKLVENLLKLSPTNLEALEMKRDLIRASGSDDQASSKSDDAPLFERMLEAYKRGDFKNATELAAQVVFPIKHAIEARNVLIELEADLETTKMHAQKVKEKYPLVENFMT